MDDYQRRFEAAVHELEAAGIKPSKANAFGTHALRKLGFRVRPSAYSKFWAAAAYHGAFFGVTWGVLMYLFTWTEQGHSVAHAVFVSCIAGLLFGVAMAVLTKWSQKRYALKKWEEL